MKIPHKAWKETVVMLVVVQRLEVSKPILKNESIIVKIRHVIPPPTRPTNRCWNFSSSFTNWMGHHYIKLKVVSHWIYSSNSSLYTTISVVCKPENERTCQNVFTPGVYNRCTQNVNESFNGMIWDRVPKAIYVELDNLSLGVYDILPILMMQQ